MRTSPRSREGSTGSPEVAGARSKRGVVGVGATVTSAAGIVTSSVSSRSALCSGDGTGDPFRCADPPIPGFAIGRSQTAVRAQQPPRSGLTPAAKDAEGATRHHRPALSLTAPRVGTASSAGLDPAPARCRPRPARTAGPPTPGRNAGTSRCGARCARRCTRTVPSPRRPVRRRRRDHPGMRRVVARTQHDPA